MIWDLLFMLLAFLTVASIVLFAIYCAVLWATDTPRYEVRNWIDVRRLDARVKQAEKKVKKKDLGHWVTEEEKDDLNAALAELEDAKAARREFSPRSRNKTSYY